LLTLLLLSQPCPCNNPNHQPTKGMAAGLPKYVTVNLSELEGAFEDGATVDLQAVQEKKLLNISGRETKLALKVYLRCGTFSARSPA
jgi:hypothetical protein